MQVPDRFWKKFADADAHAAANPRQEDLAHTRAALAMCENIDWNVGRLLAKLDQLKVASDTLVVYFHDNGPNGTLERPDAPDAKAPWTRAASDRLCWSLAGKKSPPPGAWNRSPLPSTCSRPWRSWRACPSGRKTARRRQLETTLARHKPHELADPHPLLPLERPVARATAPDGAGRLYDIQADPFQRAT